MTRQEALISLNKVYGLGSLRLKKLLEFFPQPQNILKAPVRKLAAICGIGEGIAGQIKALDRRDLDEEFALAKKYGLEIITLEDADYPENLRHIPDPPLVLYLKGELQAQDNSAIAIVGSRRASLYGLGCAEKFAQELSGRGFTIVSGMARGIDTYAHRGALKVGRRTIAVMGSGFQHIYPPENRQLLEEIVEQGAVISEFPVDTLPLAQNFPRRNRLISGLSLGVLVVEAARNSGALITADFALEQGREVFALPGKVDAENSLGTNGLIKQGAKLVSCVEDILEEFNLAVESEADSKAEEASGQGAPKLPQRELLLYRLISDHPILLDEIVEKSGLTVAEASSVLLRLEIRKLIQQLPGKQFVRSTHER